MATIQTSCTARNLIGFGLCSLLAVACGSSNANKDTGVVSDGPNWNDVTVPDVTIPKVDKEQIGNAIFDESQVQSYYLTFSDQEYAKLMDMKTLLVNSYTVNEDRYVQAALTVGDTELPAIGVRFKGNYSILGCIDVATHQRVKRVEPFFGNVDVCQRFSFKLDFDRYADDYRLDGLKKLNLQAMAADPSKMRERLSYSLFRDMDILTPRAVHARVYINGQYQGVFAAVEEVDGRFTSQRFPAAGNGNVYKNVWPSANLTSSDAQAALKTNNDVPDVSDFLAFKDAIAASTDADFATKIAPYVDLDYLARYIVVDRGINNFDGIMAFYFGLGWGPANQNYYWYDVGASSFALIPWDFDKSFWYPEPNFWSDNAPNGKNIVPNWNVTTNNCNGYTCSFDNITVKNGVATNADYGVREIDCDPFLKLLRGAIYGKQKAIADAFIAGPFSQQNVTAKLSAWRTQIAGAMGEDPLMDTAQWQSAVDSLVASLPKLQANLSTMMSGMISE